jgi:ribosomal protein L37E
MDKKLMGKNFRKDGITYCMQCQICGKENYTINVATGICTWCGEDHNFYNDKEVIL